MRTALFLVMFISESAILVLKLRDLRRNPESRFLRALCVAVALAAMSAFAGIPAMLTFLETTTRWPAIWLLGLLVATCAAMQATVLLWSTPTHGGHRRLLAMIATYGAAIAIMVILVYKGRAHITTAEITAHQQAPEILWGRTPYLREAVLVYFTALIATFGELPRHFYGNARLVDRRWLRRGLLTLPIGCFLFLVYLLAMTAYFVALRFDITLQSLHDWSIDAVALSVLVFMTGVAMPSVGPRWDRLLAYRRLKPLWLALRRAAPGLVLDDPWSAHLDGWSVRNLDFRLYRRVIEIRDGALALRPYFEPAIAESVRREAALTQLPEQQIIASIEAAQLAHAIHARSTGREPPAHDWTMPPADNGGSLDAELTSLVPLAQAFAASPDRGVSR